MSSLTIRLLSEIRHISRNRGLGSFGLVAPEFFEPCVHGEEDDGKDDAGHL